MTVALLSMTKHEADFFKAFDIKPRDKMWCDEKEKVNLLRNMK